MPVLVLARTGSPALFRDFPIFFEKKIAICMSKQYDMICHSTMGASKMAVQSCTVRRIDFFIPEPVSRRYDDTFLRTEFSQKIDALGVSRPKKYL